MRGCQLFLKRQCKYFGYVSHYVAQLPSSVVARKQPYYGCNEPNTNIAVLKKKVYKNGFQGHAQWCDP